VIPLGIEIVVEPSLRMVAAAAGFAVLATLCFALGPAWSLSRPEVTSDLKGQPGGLTRRLAIGSLLAVGQLAVSLALVAAGGLFVRGAIHAAAADPRFAPRHQLVLAGGPGRAGYDAAPSGGAFRTRRPRP